MAEDDPRDLEAEEAALYAGIISREAAHYLRETLEPGDFYHLGHQAIFQALTAGLEEGEVGIMVVKKKLREAGQWEENDAKWGGARGTFWKLLDSWRDAAWVSVNVGYYCHVVREEACRRKLMRAAERARKKAAEAGTDIKETSQEVRAAVADIERKVEEGERGIKEIMAALNAEYEEVRESGHAPGIETGHRWLDAKLIDRGLRPGHMMVVGGRPSSGKTVLGANIACHAAVSNNIPTAIYSAEQPKRDIVERCLIHLSQIKKKDLYRALTPEDSKKWERAEEALRSAPLYITQDRAQDVEDITADVRWQADKMGLKLVIVDYIQYLEAENCGSRRRNEEVAYIARRLSKVAGELDVALIAMSQLNRESGKQTIRAPKPTDLRNSGTLEQDADVILLMSRKDTIGMQASEVMPESEEEVQRSFVLSKQRNGPTGQQPYVKLTRPLMSFWTPKWEVSDGEEGSAEETAESGEAEGQNDQASSGNGGAKGRDRASTQEGEKGDGFDVAEGEIPF